MPHALFAHVAVPTLQGAPASPLPPSPGGMPASGLSLLPGVSALASAVEHEVVHAPQWAALVVRSKHDPASLKQYTSGEVHPAFPSPPASPLVASGPVLASPPVMPLSSPVCVAAVAHAATPAQTATPTQRHILRVYRERQQPHTSNPWRLRGLAASPFFASRVYSGSREMNQDEAKLLAAKAAIEELPASGVIGLGSGSTAKLFVDEVGARVKAGASYRGVPTSQGTRTQALDLGIPLLGDEDPWELISVTVDGADEVDEHLSLIKGGGGALTREKIVNASSKRNVIIVDESKMKKRLGETWAVPVEVLRFGFFGTCERLGKLGGVKQRMKDGKVFITDAGNYIVDVKTGPMDDPNAIDRAMRDIPGVVETGLFIARADLVIIAGPNGIRHAHRGAR